MVDTDSDDDQYQRQDERDIFQRLYEGGQDENKNRLQNKYGKDVDNYNFDKNKINDGINKNRGCTDIICLIVFLAFLGSLGYLTVHSYQNG